MVSCFQWSEHQHISFLIFNGCVLLFLDCDSAFCDSAHKFCVDVFNANLYFGLDASSGHSVEIIPVFPQ